MFVSEFVKFATTLPPERVDGQPKSPKQDSFLVDAIRQHGIPITVTDYETGVEEEPLPKKAAGDGLGKYSEDQPRDEKGRFSGNGSIAESAHSKEQHEAAAAYHDKKSKELSESNPAAAHAHVEAKYSHAFAASQHELAGTGKGSSERYEDAGNFARDKSVAAHRLESN